MPPAPIIVLVDCASDGAQSNWPPDGDELHAVDDVLYLQKIAQRWMQDQGQAQSGVKYTLSQLPTGYKLFGKNRINSTHVDRYLCGNAKYKYRSTEEFFDHFKSLMLNGNADNCQCIACSGKRGPKRPRLSGVNGTPTAKRILTGKTFGSLSEIIAADNILPDLSTHRNTFKNVKRQVDEAGNPDVYTMLIARLKEANEVDVPITQPDSFDWLMTRTLVSQFVVETKQKPRFLPRLGEIVLFVRDLGPADFVAVNPRTKTFEVFSAEPGTFTLQPQWEAGIVTQRPNCEIDMADLAIQSGRHKKVQAAEACFRIEPMSQVRSDDKQWSKRACHVLLHQIRPFDMYHDLLGEMPQATYHPTIMHAMTITSTFSVFSPCHFRGKWPTATVFCRGVYLGQQLICVGDVVRLLPDSDQDNLVQDVIHITSIKTKFVNLEAESDPAIVEGDEPVGPRYHETCLHIAGIGYTLDPKRAFSATTTRLGLGLDGYGAWYHLHDPKRRWEVPFTRVLGRCFEDQAVIRFLEGPDPMTTNDTAVISTGLAAMRAARRHSVETDGRILDGKSWFWADTRVEQLDLHVVNGIVVTDYDDLSNQNSKAWLRAIRRRARGADHRLVSKDNHAHPPEPGTNAMVSASAVEVDIDMKEHLDSIDELISGSGADANILGQKQSQPQSVITLD